MFTCAAVAGPVLWPDVAKDQSATKAENEFARTFDSSNKIVFSRDHYTVPKEIGELFERSFKTKYLN